MATQQQTKYKILLVGDTCTDIYAYGTVERLSPEAPVPIFKPSHMEEKPGMAANVRENLLALGCEVTTMFGEPSEKCRMIDLKSMQHIIRIDKDSESDALSPDLVDLSPKYDAIVISDYDKGFIDYNTIIRLRKRFDGPIFIDTKKRDLKHFNGCYVKINEDEYNKAISFCDDLIITLGAKGAMIYGTTFSVRKVEVVDVCGCGDTFLAAMTYKYLESKNITESIVFANKASSVTVQHMGVYAPTMKEIV